MQILYRLFTVPEYYKIDEWDDDEHTPTAGQGEFIVAKHRNGGLDEIRLKFVGNLGKFENLDTFPFSNEIASSMNNAANDDTFKTLIFHLPRMPLEQTLMTTFLIKSNIH